MRHSIRGVAVPLVVLSLFAVSCTSDDEGTDSSSPPASDAASGSVAGTATADTVTEGSTAEGGTVEEVQASGSMLDAVQEAGVFRCGTRDDLPGFATLDAEGAYVGFDSDFCRVIAAAVLGDAEAVEMVSVATDDRFTSLQSGEIDALVRNTTWTATRDGVEGATFLQPTFYDGQGMMVASDSGFATLADMDGVIICVAQGTTSEGNAAAQAAKLGVEWEVRAFADVDLIQEAFVAGQCDGWSSDTSQLSGVRSTYPDGPEALTILPEIFTKEPLAPAVADGDTEWAQAVNWAILATITAEELGITSENVDTFAETEDINIQRFLGLNVEGEAVLDPGLGLPTDFAFQVVSQVGNYGEIFERHLAPLGLVRGVNALWSDGGLMYSPPYR